MGETRVVRVWLSLEHAPELILARLATNALLAVVAQGTAVVRCIAKTAHENRIVGERAGKCLH